MTDLEKLARIREARKEAEVNHQFFAAGFDSRQPEIDALKAENEMLRKDAERYRFIRAESFTSPIGVVDSRLRILDGAECDEAFDAAMADKGE